MIKDLIKDLAYDSITLSQGLTRAKLIAAKIKNDVFRQWLSKELEGYTFHDEMLPSYRKLRCIIHFRVEFRFNRWETFPYVLSEQAKREDPKFADMIEFHKATEPISIVEKNLSELTTQKGQIQLTPEITELIGDQYKAYIDGHGGVIRSSYKELAKVQLQAIIELTKQKLLDTLLSLDEQFPDLINEFNMTKDNIDKAQNIITTNIYGGNNPLNIAAGENIEQTNKASIFTPEIQEKLEKLGVEKPHIEELRTIIDSTPASDKSGLKSKVLKWLGSVTSSLVARGLYDNIPQITEFVGGLF